MVFVACGFVDINDVDCAVVVASCDKAFLLRLGEGGQEDLSHVNFLDPFLGSDIVEVDPSIISTCHNGVIDTLNLPVLHDLAFDRAKLDCITELVHV